MRPVVVLRQTLALGMLVVFACVVAETVLVRVLTLFTPIHSLDVVYLLGIVVVIASMWDLWLGVATALAGAVAFDFFLTPPLWSIRPAESEDLAVCSIFLTVALLSFALSRLARSRIVEVDVRQEADLAARLTRLLLTAPDVTKALPAAARQLERTLDSPSVSIRPGPVPPGEGHEVFPLSGNDTTATLVVPAGLPSPTRHRLRDRVVPLLETLLQAARERESVTNALRASHDEQGALRQLATLVAHGVPPREVFDAAAREMGRMLGAERTLLVRYEPNNTTISVGTWNFDEITPVGLRLPMEKGTVSELVFRTGVPGRVNSYPGPATLSTMLREHGIKSSVGCPIVVGGTLWGVAIATSDTPVPLPDGTEKRMLEFVDIAVAAVANAQGNAELKASRARVVAAADQARRRIERDLHDGTQQRLVSISLEVREIEHMIPPGQERLRAKLAHTARALDEAVVDLQEISRGVHPAILAKGGLERALAALARRSPVPVELSMSDGRPLPEPLEVSMYYVVSEALTNAAKHAHASLVQVRLAVNDAGVRLAIHDNGVGGADSGGGSGLVGLTDRVEAVGGTITIDSPPGAGTSLLVEIPAAEAAPSSDAT